MEEHNWNGLQNIQDQDQFEVTLSDKIIAGAVAFLATVAILACFYLDDIEKKFESSDTTEQINNNK